jgi:hypothetical protein
MIAPCVRFLCLLLAAALAPAAGAGYYPSQFGFTWKYMDIDLARKKGRTP